MGIRHNTRKRPKITTGIGPYARKMAFFTTGISHDTRKVAKNTTGKNVYTGIKSFFKHRVMEKAARDFKKRLP